MTKFVTLIMTVMTMFMLGIYNISFETNYGDIHIRLHDQESVTKWVDSGNFDETGIVQWNLDAKES